MKCPVLREGRLERSKKEIFEKNSKFEFFFPMKNHISRFRVLITCHSASFPASNCFFLFFAVRTFLHPLSQIRFCFGSRIINKLAFVCKS